jgi:polyphosphate kinase
MAGAKIVPWIYHSLMSTATSDDTSAKPKKKNATTPAKRTISDAVYEAELFRLQTELVKVQE